MLTIRGYYLDGQSAKRVDATLQSQNSSGFSLLTEEQSISIECADINIEAALGNTPREVSLGKSGLFISEEHEEIEQLSKLIKQGGFPFSLVHKLEHNLVSVICFTLSVIVFIWALAVHGIPHAAKTIAFEMPEYVEGHLSSSLEVLDATILEPSQLSTTRQQQLHLFFKPYLQDHEMLHPTVHFRSGMDANALALPNGDIVFTDELVKLADNDQQLVAVLFHELGHLKHKHITRRILQDSMITLAVFLITGDIDSVDMLTGIPTLVVDLAYSREFELEADKYALEMLKQSNIPVATFAEIMLLLSNHYESDEQGNQERKITDFLSTHPRTQDRIEQVNQYQQTH
ncbi:hypothetical protein CW745_05310 [Psychromonas sp. psych-6C06]|uniref:M48 family metallopeptidase n=1 Tax=Psychromonas sp. psych-6C06 TaxID=2058089 RepID=UPI000C32BD9A|nr:M48 family metallopeptidase [Psychromonas sp. psych-6C06]PKF62840.1 hypothetical protein CW745_05310 [Psychromonas sp. psych-6C06]